ncbi:MAG TPA: hypothetical protein VGV39_20155 [Mesorhizobium sp.]|jgi:hypothetical protein|uniref:hypothetical protein n=1 Tax=Mesorhizobium sp. TaxID=1871066 RepID=UPI002DDCE849|nr:hypothetical protein [Mesorhizobium sp.]HEV2505401.1 hypothetical protein [Mesorhizobium sp.]
MKRPLPSRLLSEAWDAVILAKASEGYVNVSAIAVAIRRTGRFQNVPLPGIEKAVLHATLSVGAVVEFDKGQPTRQAGEDEKRNDRLPGSGAAVQRDGAQLSTLQEK